MSEGSVSRILILDDERIIVDTLCMFIKLFGYECRGGCDHDTAMTIAREFEPDFFLSGFSNSCDENGCESMAEIQTLLPKSRTIIFSGSASAAPVNEEYFQRGYKFDVFARPVHPMDFVSGCCHMGHRQGWVLKTCYLESVARWNHVRFEIALENARDENKVRRTENEIAVRSEVDGNPLQSGAG